MKQSVITCIYSPSPRIEEKVLRCLHATEKEFPSDDRIAAIDAATANVREQCELGDWEVLELTQGQPPRMTSLIQSALSMVETEFVWTVEHDCLVLPGRRDAISSLLEAHPDAAVVSANPVGNMEIALSSKDRRLVQVLPPNYISLNCACWRTEDLRQLNWEIIPQFPDADQHISRQLQALGRGIYFSCHLTVVHLDAQARMDLP
jgi:hypothetical protein